MSINRSKHVFISYSTQDSEFVERLVSDLEDNGFQVWIDRQGLAPSTYNWEQTIRDAIMEAQAVILIATPASRESIYVQDEIQLARTYQKPVFPVWAGGRNWADAIALGMGHIQYSDVRGDSYERGLRLLVQRLRGEPPPIPKVYKRVASPLARHATVYGFQGGIGWGILMHFLYRFVLLHYLASPDSLTDQVANILRLGHVLLLIAGLFVMFLLFDREYRLASRSEQSLTGAAIGFVFALTAHFIASGAFEALLANRTLFQAVYQNLLVTSVDYRVSLNMSVYRTVVEGLGFNLFYLISITAVGALAGQALLPRDRTGFVVPAVRNVFWYLTIIVLTVTLELIATLNVVVFSLLETSLITTSADVGRTDIVQFSPIIVLYGTAMGLNFVVQVLILLWAIRVKPEHIHRTGLWATLIVYGLVVGVGRIPLMLAIYPSFAAQFPGNLILLIATLFALSFVVVALYKLWAARRQTKPSKIRISYWEMLRALSGVLLVSWLLIDFLLLRIPYNLINLPVALIASSETPSPYNSLLDSMILTVLHLPTIYWLIGGMVMILVGSILLTPLIAVVMFLERRTARE